MERILVVEDDLALSTGLCFELDAAGYVTQAAYNCRKAEYLVEQENFSLALLDVNLPDGNGFALCGKIKSLHPELPVIFLTANDLEEDMLNGYDLGAEDYVTKPFRMPILLKKWKSPCDASLQPAEQEQRQGKLQKERVTGMISCSWTSRR